MKTLTAILMTCASFALATTPAEDRDWATRVNCELQTAGPQSLPTLTFQQGTTPLLSLDQFRSGRAVNAETNGSIAAVFQFGPTATNGYYVASTNYAVCANGYLVQLPTIGTNTLATGAWWYTAYFYRNGLVSWTGNGQLNIIKTDSTADGLRWQTVASGAESDPIATPIASNALTVANAALPRSETNGWTVSSHDGFLTEEADTLETVTARGATTMSGISVRGGLSVGLGSTATGLECVGIGECDAEGIHTFAAGSSCLASGIASISLGNSGMSIHNNALVYSGIEVEYFSHGNGTFNINPVGGTAGFWIGEQTLGGLLGEKTSFTYVTNIVTNVVSEHNTNDTAHTALFASKANVETVITGDVVTAYAGNRYFWASGTNVTLSTSLSSGQIINYALLRNTATNSITVIGQPTWSVQTGELTNTIPSGKKITFGWSCEPVTGVTNYYATGVSK